jgi:hypothetical protein
MFAAVRVLTFAVAVVIGIAAPAAAEVSSAQIERARDRALTVDYQDELPGHTWVRVDGSRGGTGTGTGSGGGTARPDRLGRGSADNAHVDRDRRLGRRQTRDRDELRDTRELRRRDDDDGPMGDLMTVLMWGLLAVALGLAAFWFVSEFAKPASDVALPGEEQDDRVAAATQAIIAKPLDDADVLASQGQFVEAIHTLLLRTLHELARSAMVRVERSHTSREILARVPLLADAREALSVLITYVELTHFGDEPATAADYTKCREQFNRFAEAFRAGLAVQQRMPVAGGTALAS